MYRHPHNYISIHMYKHLYILHKCILHIQCQCFQGASAFASAVAAFDFFAEASDSYVAGDLWLRRLLNRHLGGLLLGVLLGLLLLLLLLVLLRCFGLGFLLRNMRSMRNTLPRQKITGGSESSFFSFPFSFAASLRQRQLEKCNAQK